MEELQVLKFGHLLHGGDYNPEQWLDEPDILKKDIAYFKEAGINTVSLGMFSWSMLEPEEGNFQFEWMEEVIENLYQNGISAILATPSGARPKWMADKYEEVLRVDENRNRNLFGLRHNHCYTSPVYREKIKKINKELANRFKDNPAVILWHISNEYGGECHCPLCQEAFRAWLKERYGTIEEVNQRWCTTFWSHRYLDFSQIESPSPRGETALQGLSLDWKRFVTDRTLDFMKHEIQALREAEARQPATTNFMYNFNGLDYHKFADELDLISWDSYPTWHKEEEYQTALDCGMQHDIMRSIKKQSFLLMESCPSSTNWQKVSKLRRPDMHITASLQAVAHGSDSVLYFQMRQSRGGEEKFHGAVIDHYGGNDTRVFKEVCRTGKALEALGQIAGSQVKAEAAVIYDWDCRWAVEGSAGPRNCGMYYKESVEKSYNGLRRQGLNVDVISTDQPLEGYKLVIAPMVYMFRNGFERRVRQFVDQGGIFVLTYWSGVVDENDRCYLGGTPYGLMDVMGLRSTEIDGLYDGEINHFYPVDKNEAGLDSVYTCEHLCQLVELTTAKSLMVYGDDFYKKTPAVTYNAFGKGSAYYVCADAEQYFYTDFYEKLVKKAGIETILGEKLPQGIEVTSRFTKEAEYIFIQNYRKKEKKILLPQGGWEIVYGDGSGALAPLSTLVLKRSRKEL